MAGLSTYNVMVKEWIEHDYRLTAKVFGLRLLGTLGWVDYGNLLQSALNDAFSPTLIDPEGRLTTLGGWVDSCRAGT